MPNRPLLLPQNRRLRHLCGISLRNLSFHRPHGRTIDDAAINKSPNKLDTLREASQLHLHHSHSTESLVKNTKPLPPPRPRRRSTSLAGASPITRQKKLEYAVESAVADVFFSLHCEGLEQPVYISETGRRATNFNFQLFELTSLPPFITRSSQVTVKVWATRQQACSLLLEDDIDLRFLSFVESLDSLHMPPNCLIFHLVDGIYAFDLSTKPQPPKQGPSLPTSSYNSLMKLSTLDNSVQDALAAQEKLVSQIDDILARSPDIPVAEEEDKVALARRFLSQQERAVTAARRRRDELRESIRARREAIALGRKLQEEARRDVENATEQLAASRQILGQTGESIRGQRRRICEDLIRIFPITETGSGQPLSFQICGIPVPNTAYDPLALAAKGKDKGAGAPPGEDALSAGLGLVAQLTDALQSYLGVALPYPIRTFGSRSSIRDDISMLPEPQREFPLHVPRGGSSAQYRFDYGWFLLNKNVEMLCTAQGARVVDIRHTLPNLKYLLFVCSAGKDELPQRKKGGIRGLWQGQLRSRGVELGFAGAADSDFGGGNGSADGSRRGSAESEVLARQREELRKALRESGQGNGGGGSVSSSLSTVIGLPFDEDGTKLPLRAKGLRGDGVK